MDKWETRPSQYGAWDVYVRQTNQPDSIITEDLKEKAFASIGSVLEVPVIDYDGTVTIGNTRSVTIADSENTSQMITITFATYSWGFTIVPMMYNNNEIKMQRDFQAKFIKYLYQFATVLDQTAVAALESNKTQVLGDPLVYTFAADTVTASNAQRLDIIGDLGPMMHSNDYYNPLDIVGNPGTESLLGRIHERGLYNEENKEIQLNGKTFHWSNNVTNGVGVAATMYCIPTGSLGILTRFDRSAIARDRSRTGHEWDIMTLPMLGIGCGTYYYESVGDYSAIAGAATADITRVKKEHYGFDVDVAFVHQHNSDPATRANAPLKAEVRTA